MLTDWLLPQLQTMDSFNSQRLFFMQDGAPPHWARAVRDWLDITFGERWIGRGGPVPWPPRSPDLTPMDFWFWGDLKWRVYAGNHFHTIEDLKEKIQRCVTEISDEVRISAVSSFRNRLIRCSENNGGHIES